MERLSNVEPKSAPCGKTRREGDDREQDGDSADIADGIEVADTEEPDAEKARRYSCQHGPADKAEGDGPHELLKERRAKVDFRRSQSEADGNLTSAL